jgi:hypothetical protein
MFCHKMNFGNQEPISYCHLFSYESYRVISYICYVVMYIFYVVRCSFVMSFDLLSSFLLYFSIYADCSS